MAQRRGLLVTLLLVSALMAGCGGLREMSVRPGASAQPIRGEVVATIAQAEPGNALRLYLHGWMSRYNDRALGERRGTSDSPWAPETPDDFVSVMPAVPMTDFETVTVWSAKVRVLGPVSKTHAAYAADLMFWRGNPLSSAGPGAAPLSSTATYDLSWDDGQGAWVIRRTSESPDRNLIESSDESTGLP